MALNKFQSFVGDLGTAKINLNGDTLFVMLTNTAPNAADNIVDTTTSTCTLKSTSNALEIAAGNGYTKKGAQTAGQSYSQSSGTGTLIFNAVSYTASGGSIGPFRYGVLFDDSSGTTSTRSVIGWFDYGSSITLNNGESFKWAADTLGSNWSSGTPVLSIA